MAKKDSGKDKSTSELELIKSTLETDLDESSVDIFSSDLFAPPKPAVKEEPAPTPAPEPEKPAAIAKPEPAPTAPEAKPVETKKAEEPKPEPEKKRVEPPGDELKAEKNVEELDLNIETGELKTLAASKEEKQDETEASLTQLEKMGGDLLSVDELKKLFKNMNTMIDLLTLAMVRLDSLEKKIKGSKK